MTGHSACAVDGGDGGGFGKLLSSFGAHEGVYRCSPSKRPRRRLRKEKEEEEEPFPIDALPDECLFEVLRRLPGNRERAFAACVSKRWLAVLSSIHPASILRSPSDGTPVTRLLAGTSASDVALTAATAHANGSGGMDRLWVHADGSARLTDSGVASAARGSRSLTSLALDDVPHVTDEGLREVARFCPLLERLDLHSCPGFTDEALLAIAVGCPLLTSLSLEDCPRVGDDGLRAVGRRCRRLESISIGWCPLVGDRGVASLVSSASSSLTDIAFRCLNVSDVSLAVVGRYGNSVTGLVLCGLKDVNERGFWVMGNAGGLKSLKFLEIAACRGATDLGVEAVAKGCPELRRLSVNRCPSLSDAGLAAVARTATSLESLHLVGCDRITLLGVRNAIRSDSLKTLSLAGCARIGDRDASRVPDDDPPRRRGSIRSISVRDCRFFGDLCLKAMLAACPRLQSLELLGALAATKAGLLHLIEMKGLGLASVNLGGCAAVVDDDVVSAVARAHGGTLRLLNLGGCRKVTDSGVMDICYNCDVLWEVDLSKSAVTDFGVGALATTGPPPLQVMSLSGCAEISEDSLLYLSSTRQWLLGLDIRHCKQISRSAIRAFKKKMKACDIIS